jgi:molybdopterin molybdotransferase
VIRVEDTDSEAHPGRVFVFRDRDGGRNIRPAGQDVRPGDKVLTRGQAVHAGTVAVLAALGRDRVSVFRRPTVAIVTTGDELRPLDDFAGGRGATGVPDSNGPMLAACAVAAGAVPRSFGPISDERAALREALGHTLSADVLVTVGGASMGEADLVKRVLDELGFRTGFWRVRMRPGSPFGFGWLPSAGRSQPVFSLPGNPASSYVTFELFVRPFLLRLAGHRQIHRRRVRCVAAEEFRGSDLTLFLRVRLASEGAEIVAHSAGPQGSGLVRGLAEAHGLAIVPEGRSVAAGAHVDVILLDPEAGPAAASPLEGLGG